MTNQTLETCLRQLASGVSLEECLAAYPEQRAELEPMLHAAARLQSAGQLTAPPAFKQNARTRLLEKIASQPQQQAAPIPPPPPARPWWDRLLDAFRRPLAMPSMAVAAVIALMLLFGVFATTATVAQAALPGDPLYPVKLWEERLQVRFSDDPVQLQLEFAERRLQESLALQQEQRYDDMKQALVFYRQQMNAWAPIAQKEGILQQERVQQRLRRQAQFLEMLEQTAPVQQRNMVREMHRQIQPLMQGPGPRPRPASTPAPTITPDANRQKEMTPPAPGAMPPGNDKDHQQRGRSGPATRMPDMPGPQATPNPQKNHARTPRPHGPVLSPTPAPMPTEEALSSPTPPATPSPQQPMMTPQREQAAPTADHGGQAPHTPMPTSGPGNRKGKGK